MSEYGKRKKVAGIIGHIKQDIHKGINAKEEIKFWETKLENLTIPAWVEAPAPRGWIKKYIKGKTLRQKFSN